MSRHYLLILSFALSLKLAAQKKSDYVFNHLDQSSGFPSKLVRCMTHDKSGLIWMLTDKGLMKYNGHSGKFYPPRDDSSGLLKAATLSIYADKEGLIWIGYNETYLSSFNPNTEKFTHYFTNEKDEASFPPGGAVKFMEDRKGNLWIAVWGGGLSRFNRKTGNFKTYRPDKANPKTTISTHNTTEVIELPDGRLMIGSWEGDGFKNSFLQYFDPAKEEFEKFDFDSYTCDNEHEKGALYHALRIIHFIYPEPNGNKWIGTFLGLVYINEKNKTIKRYSGIGGRSELGGGRYENALNYVVDNTGKLWISTEVTGIMVIDPITKKCSYITHSFQNAMSISGDNIFSMYKDEDENIWVCTAGGGIDVYTPLLQQFKFIENEALEAERSNRAQGQSAVGKLLLSKNSDDVYLCHGNGLTVYSPAHDSIRRIDTREIFKNNKGRYGIKEIEQSAGVVGFVHEIGNKLAICAQQGLILYDKKTKAVSFPHYEDYTFIDFEKNSHCIVATARSKKANDWNARLVQMDTNFKVLKEIHYPEWPYQDMRGYYNAGYIKTLGQHHWFINFNEAMFYIYNDETSEFKQYSSRKPFSNFPDSVLMPLTKDKDDFIWIKGSGGIYRFNYRTGKSQCYNGIFKIGKEIVYNLTVDTTGILWIALKQDLIRFDPKTGQTFRFNQKLGLNVGGFARVHTDINTRGEIYILSSYGLLHFDPKALKFSNQSPDIFLSGVTINKDTLNEIELEDFLKNSTLTYNQNHLTFEYTTVQMYTPGPKQYEYRLLGLDSAWYNNENRNYISYPGLANGSYTLEIKCKNVYNVRSRVFSFKFTIEAPVWKRWWFILSEIILAIGMIGLFIRRREKKLQADKLKLENTVTERTKEVVEKAHEIEIQNEIIFEKNKELTDSIKYAERIQKALLANNEFMKEHLPSHFILFKPKAIVSGDFYWACLSARFDLFYLAVCDCTGHGVPGAFMSLLNISFLNEAIAEKNIVEPDQVLNYVRSKLISNLSSDQGSDGMDGTLLCFNKKKNLMTYASAANRPILIRSGVMQELPADKMPIGKGEKENSFTLNSIQLQKDDMIYFYSDGYADQFGGEKGKKFKYRQLNELLLGISNHSPEKQRSILDETFESWRGNLEQVDDILVIGIKI